MNIQDVRQKLIDAGFIKEHEIAGLSADEIAALADDLPADYQQFLGWMGRKMGRVFLGEDATYEHLQRLQQEARDTALEGGLTLPKGFFSFLGHQGYQYYYFVPGESAVYVFEEGDDQPRKVAGSFAEFLDSWLIEAKGIEDSMPSNVKFMTLEEFEKLRQK